MQLKKRCSEQYIRYANSEEDIYQIRNMFIEYSKNLNFSLCFQNFEQELNELPGVYAAPAGVILMAYIQDKLAGCVALKIKLYAQFNFKRIKEYRENPIAGAIYMALKI